MKTFIWTLFAAFVGVLFCGVYLYKSRMNTDERMLAFQNAMFTNVFSSLIIGFFVSIGVYIIQSDQQALDIRRDKFNAEVESEKRVLAL